MGMQLVHFITCVCESSAPFFVIYKAVFEPTPYLVIGLYELLDSATSFTKANCHMNIHSLLSRRSLTRQCIYLHLYLALSLQRNQESPIWGTCWQSRGESSRNTTNSRWSSRSQCPRRKKIGWIETLMMYLGVFPLQTTTMVGIIGISVSATVRDITYTLSRCTTHFEHVGHFVTE